MRRKHLKDLDVNRRMLKHLMDIQRKCLDIIHLKQNRVQWQVFVKMIMNRRVP